ncbi:amidohydrolase [Aquipuribacter nitratireducens]|uniref:Amidohydrolase n=1 Tax=Aquipuribacter nitratireducens TaxID=650104 RepID=A0ABW0GID7_9MICO
MSTATRTLYRHGAVYSPADPYAQALLVEDGTVAWVGGDEAADSLAGGLGADDRVVDLAGALVTPAFVDGHVHCFDTGLLATGVDLTGVRSVGALLDAVAAFAAAHPGERVLGHGWDETLLAEGRPPTSEELERAAPGALVYLSRVDVHSALVSRRLVDEAGAAGLPGHDGSARVERDAHHLTRSHARDVPAGVRAAAHEAALRAALAAGIGTLHEMSGPFIGGPDDLRVLVGVAAEVGARVVPYWGEAATDADHARALVAGLGLPAGVRLAGLAGDLSADGSIGSRTAAFREPYADNDPAHPTHAGHAYLSADVMADHLVACVGAGVQPGFHVIGDAALDTVLEALDRAADRLGGARLATSRVRLEHVETADDAQVAALARHGVVASMQPLFDALWGGDDSLYARRLGAHRRLNRVGAVAAAGIPLAFGSDSPVTPLDPWGTVAAAAFHHDEAERISARAAFAASTRGAHRAAFDDRHLADAAGVLVPGAPADLAVWEAGELVVQAPDDRIQAWSTDPRSRVPALPDLGPGSLRPRCLRTVVAGRTRHDTGELIEAGA